MSKTFTAIIEYDSGTKQYVGMVPDVHTAGSSLEEVRKNLKEVLELVLEETGDEINHQEFLALEMIEVET
ncbi:MAG TPA: type II toxin-antitoxin system HicB family antitoxin [Pseudothermotoga sp.]|nr:type II toxin-antitoxin system HicB family antitoxin [Pseudothermotoga sp.]